MNRERDKVVIVMRGGFVAEVKAGNANLQVHVLDMDSPGTDEVDNGNRAGWDLEQEANSLPYYVW